MEDFLNSLNTGAADTLISAIIKILGALLLLIIGLKLIKMFTKRMRKKNYFSKMDASVRSFIYSGLSIILKLIVIITAISILGVPLTAITAAISSVGLAIGLALQGSLSNLAGGVMILTFRPFKIGDFVDTHTDTGTVEDISVFYTTLLTMDNKTVIIPNSVVSNNTIVNYTAKGVRRLDLEFGVSYDSDIDKVKDVLVKCALKNDKALKEPEAKAKLLKHDQSALIFVLQVWCGISDYADLKFELNEDVKKAFDENGIEIPFQQLDIHINDRGEKYEIKA